MTQKKDEKSVRVCMHVRREMSGKMNSHLTSAHNVEWPGKVIFLYILIWRNFPTGTQIMICERCVR